jgi:hypothetical protein
LPADGWLSTALIAAGRVSGFRSSQPVAGAEQLALNWGHIVHTKITKREHLNLSVTVAKVVAAVRL